MSAAAALWRRLRFAPLYLALRAAAALAPRDRNPWPRRGRDEPSGPGLDLLIPERGTPDLLARTLAAAVEAQRRCG